MLAAFLTQWAAGCSLVVAASATRESGWRYLRLMAAVCLGLLLLAGAILVQSGIGGVAGAGLAIGVLLSVVWMTVNAVQGEAVRASQRTAALGAGAAGLVAAVMLATRPDPSLTAPIGLGSPAMAASMALGAMMLGAVTASMLLGHRYLTDTDMSIAPLRRLTKLYLAAVAARAAWVLAVGVHAWSSGLPPRGESVWFWFMMTVRFGVGIVGVGIFALMAWDCVRRRATQSATAMFYLSMVLVFFGELAGHYLMRSAGMAM